MRRKPAEITVEKRTFSTNLPIPVAVMPRPPNMSVASSAVSRPVRVMNLCASIAVNYATSGDEPENGAAYCFRSPIGPASLSDCSLYDISEGVNAGLGGMSRRETYVVHLVRDKLQPVLPSLDARDHAREPGAYDGLCVERLAEHDALVRPLEALLDNPTLGTEARGRDHPPLVVEVAEDNVHALADRAEGVRHGHARLVERNVGCACGGGVGRLDGFGRNVVGTRN